MPAPDVNEIRRRLERLRYPGFPHDVVRYGVVHRIEVAGGEVTIVLLEASASAEKNALVRDRIARAVSEAPGVASVRLATAAPPAADPRAGEAPPSSGAIPIAGVGRVIAVSSCKGGVGKSTVAVNLALALARQGLRVGLLDADVYGPSIPMMLGIEGRPRVVGERLEPVAAAGIVTMSMGYFLDDRSPVIWRGPMVMSLVRQFLRDVDWGELDHLVVDMPPGTGDAALTLAQLVPISGAVVVTTPQEVALADVERGIGMFRQVHVPVLGLIENMAEWVCPSCGTPEAIFGAGGAGRLAAALGLPVLGRIPLVAEIRAGGDTGRPIVAADPDHPAARELAAVATRVAEALAEASVPGPAMPAGSRS